MTAAVILLFGIAAAVLLWICLLQRKENDRIAKQLEELKAKDTNMLVHSENGGADRLINEINLLLKELRQNKVEYRQKKHELQQMMTNISHDLRTPLTSALGYIDMIQRSGLSEEEKQHGLMIVEQRLKRLEELIDSFFEFSQIISREKEPERSELDLVAVLQDCIVHYYDDYCGRGRSIRFECSERRIMISSNKSMLMRIFDNLIGNALKHGAGELVITVDAAAMAISFENPSDEFGIDAERVFDEFYTTDISRTKGNTGLGLAIAKQFTEMLGGSISASFENGRFGVTVRL